MKLRMQTASQILRSLISAADDEPDTLDPQAMEATVELCVALVAALDEDLARREAGDDRTAPDDEASPTPSPPRPAR